MGNDIYFDDRRSVIAGYRDRAELLISAVPMPVRSIPAVKEANELVCELLEFSALLVAQLEVKGG